MELKTAKTSAENVGDTTCTSDNSGAELDAVRGQLLTVTKELEMLQQQKSGDSVTITAASAAAVTQSERMYAELEEERRRLQSENDFLESKIVSLESRLADAKTSAEGGDEEGVGEGEAVDLEAGGGATSGGLSVSGLAGSCFISTPKRDGYRKGRIGAPLSLIKLWTAARVVLPAKVFDYIGETPPVLGLTGQFVFIAYFLLLQVIALYVWLM